MAHPALYISIGLLLALFFFGITLNEGTRWIRILGFTFQPSDIAKIGLVLYIAKVLEEETVISFREFAIRIMLPVSFVCGIILWSGTSTALLLAGTCFLILFIGGIKWSYLMRFVSLGIIAVVLVIAFGLTPRAETVRNRLITFVSSNNEGEDVEKNKKEDANTFQADQAKIAIATGGLTGKGPGNSTQRHIVPHPYSDFIFAIIVEEYGIVGAIIVIFLYWILLYRAIAIAKLCTLIFSTITVLGIMLLLVLQAMINMGVAVGLFPVTGQTLPLISLGGSSLFATSLALGIILSVSRATEERDMPQPAVEEKTEAIPAN
jgi:cell division protein FtsW